MTTLGQFTTVCRNRREGNIPEIPVDPEQRRRRQQVIEQWSRFKQEYLTQYPNGTPFVVACELGRLNVVEAAISATLAAGLDVTVMVSEIGRDSDGESWTPLMAAAKNEYSTIIRILLEYNADPAITDNHGYNVLHWAAWFNRTTTTIVGLLLNKMQLEAINHKNNSGFTPLDMVSYFCRNEQEQILQKQIINLIRQKGGKKKWELDFEMEEGTLDSKYKKTFPLGTPFVVACEKGRVDDVKVMIEGARAAGIDVRAMVSKLGTDSAGNSMTPLMAASYEDDHSNIIDILLYYNADTAITDNHGYNVLHWAVAMVEISTLTVELLLNNMKLEDINHKDDDGNTPLDIGYGNNDSSFKQQLIDLIREKGGKRARELLKRASNLDGGSNKRQKTQLYLTLSNLKF